MAQLLNNPTSVIHQDSFLLILVQVRFHNGITSIHVSSYFLLLIEKEASIVQATNPT